MTLSGLSHDLLLHRFSSQRKHSEDPASESFVATAKTHPPRGEPFVEGFGRGSGRQAARVDAVWVRAVPAGCLVRMTSEKCSQALEAGWRVQSGLLVPFPTKSGARTPPHP